MKEKIIILDFGSQYTQLIARRVRENNVYCEIQPYNKALEFEDGLRGIILSGSPVSVTGIDPLELALDELVGMVPILAICYGAQLFAHQYGGKVEQSMHREYGKAMLKAEMVGYSLMEGLQEETQVWMSHGDTILELPDGFQLTASTQNIPIAAFYSDEMNVHCLQFHPEVTHSLEGREIIRNFLFKIADCKGEWTPEQFVHDSIQKIKNRVGEASVIMAISGGVDSTVAASIIHKAIGEQLHCIFVDNGLLRKDEYKQVLQDYDKIGLNVHGIEAAERFYAALEGVSDPEKKRKIIGGLFIEIFEEEAKKIKDVQFLGQGTIYPDVIESVSVQGPSVTIKSHHNVGGLPEKMNLELLEPLRMLFKDEVRLIGREVDVPERMLQRHPFPGPGLAIRILSDITAEKVKILQEADNIYIQKLKDADYYDKIWQAGTILLPVRSVGVMGDERTYENTIALRAVNSMDGMTAEWTRIPYELLAEISSEIINKVNGVNRVVYDISTKPPATIEWE